METKIIKIIIMLIIISLKLNCSAQKLSKKQLNLNTYRSKQTIILKEYFLCNCIQYGFEKGDVNLSQLDHTIQFYEEELWAKIIKLDRLSISEYAKNKAKNFQISPLSNKYGIMGLCLDLYKSDSLNLFINKIVKKNIKIVPKI
jgi:hypothetical protein